MCITEETAGTVWRRLSTVCSLFGDTSHLLNTAISFSRIRSLLLFFFTHFMAKCFPVFLSFTIKTSANAPLKNKRKKWLNGQVAGLYLLIWESMMQDLCYVSKGGFNEGCDFLTPRRPARCTTCNSVNNSYRRQHLKSETQTPYASCICALGMYWLLRERALIFYFAVLLCLSKSLETVFS